MCKGERQEHIQNSYLCTHTSHQILTYLCLLANTHTHTHTHTHTGRAVCTQLTHTFRPPMQLPALDNLSFNSATLHAVLYRLLPACTATHLVILCGWQPRSGALHCSVLNVPLQLNPRRVLSVGTLLPSLARLLGRSHDTSTIHNKENGVDRILTIIILIL